MLERRKMGCKEDSHGELKNRKNLFHVAGRASGDRLLLIISQGASLGTMSRENLSPTISPTYLMSLSGVSVEARLETV